MNTRLQTTALLALLCAAPAHAAGPRRIDLDITGDGQPEIFVARAFAGAPGGDVFEVFTPQADGSLGVLGRLAFDPAQGFRVDAAHRRVTVLVAPESGRAVLSVYALEAGFRRLSRKEMVADEAALAREREAQRRFWTRARRVETTGETARGGETVWRDVATGKAVAGLRRLAAPAETKARR